MIFSDVVSAVVSIVKRPDKVSDIERAINAAISDCTVKASFSYDLVETSIPIDPTLYGDTVTFNNLVTPVVIRFRKFKYVKPTAVRRYLQQIAPEKLFTPSNIVQPDSYYVAGNNLTYTLRELSPTLEVGYYQYAPILSGSDTYWMLDMMPWAIIDLAAARVFRSIGDDNSYKAFVATGMDSFRLSRNDYEDAILPVAR